MDIVTEPETKANIRSSQEWQLYRKTLTWVVTFIGLLAIIAVGVGWLTAGLPGVWGALVGAGIAALFCGTTVWSIGATIGSSPTQMAATVMLTWAAKLAVLIAVLALLRGRDFYHPVVLFLVIVIGVVGALAIQAISVKGARLPYVAPR